MKTFLLSLISARHSGCVPCTLGRLILAGLVTPAVAALEPVAEFTGFKSAVQTLSYSPDQKFLAGGDESGKVIILDLATGTPVADLSGYEATGSRVFWSPNSKIVYRLGVEGIVISQRDGNGSSKVKPGVQSPRQLVLSPDGRILGVAGTGSVAFFSADTGQALATVEPHPNYRISYLSISHDGKLAASTCEERVVRFIELPSGNFGPSLELEHKPLAMGFSPVAAELVVIDTSAILHRLAVPSGVDKTVSIPGGRVQDLAQSPDGKWIAVVGGIDIRLCPRDESKWRTHRLSNTVLGARSAAFSPDSKFLAVGEHDRRVRVWRVADFSVEP